MSLTTKLFELQDIGYRDFHAKLIPTIDKNSIIGVRIPELRKLARQVAGTDEARDFLSQLPHRYYDENNLHAFIIELTRDYDEAMRLTNLFLPHIDNWATCDSFTPKVFSRHHDELLEAVNTWIVSNHTYTVRYAIRMLMAFFLDERFKPEYAQMVADVKSDEYYIKMMIAWYFATALAKQYDTALGFITSRSLDTWIHNKAIQKAIESYRITNEQKEMLRKLKC